MAKYRPATVDDGDVIARIERERRRTELASSRPVGSNVYATTEKVRKLAKAAKWTLTKSGSTVTLSNADGSVTSSVEDSDTTYADATESADGLMSAADKAKLDGVADGANAYALPVGACVVMASDAPPGIDGTWERLTAWHVPMTGVTLYIYERTE